MKTILLALLMMSTNAFAMGGRGEHFKKELNLTDEQVEKFRELRKNRGELKELKSAFKESKKAFGEAMKNPKVSQQELTAKFENFMKLREEFQRKRFAKMMEKRAILTPEQIVKFNELRKKRKKGGKGKHKRW